VATVVDLATAATACVLMVIGILMVMGAIFLVATIVFVNQMDGENYQNNYRLST
jgi:hypothetical protein